MSKFIDLEGIEKFLVNAVNHYEKSAPTVSRYADDLYVRLQEKRPVQLWEVLTVLELRTPDGWLQANFAANLIYKLEDRMGRNISGQYGF